MKKIKINEIEGFKFGHAQDEAGATGCTVVLCEKGATAGVDVRGGAPATRETDLLNPVNMVEQIHAVMLSGGSAYGLDAASGAMAYLEEQGVGFDVGVGLVPIVCGAALFDLAVGDPGSRPDKAMGYAACKNAGAGANTGTVPEGNVGAGTGATVGKYLGPERMMKSGLGAYAVSLGAVKCGAIVAVNALGDVIDIETGKPIAGILNEAKTAIASTEAIMYAEIENQENQHNVFSGSNENQGDAHNEIKKNQHDHYSGNTTIGCILTNVKLTKSQANKLASTAHNGYARAIRPVHTSADGDTIFLLSTGEVEASADALGMLAAEVMAKAINRAAKAAKSAYGLKSARDFE
jgi:L-aminopeptidase/D-esterase-like protein